MTFSKQLTNFRYQLGWSQERVAKLVPGGVTAQTVGRWERGQNLPNATTQQFVLAKLKSTIEAEIRQENQTSEQGMVFSVRPVEHIEPGLAALAEVLFWFRALPPAEQQTALAAISGAVANAQDAG